MRLAVLLTLLLAVPALAEDRPPTGILWNRSGLPARIPFQMQTPEGRDYAVMMIEVGTTRTRMAGYARGGEFFRLLMPPGDYLLRIAAGPPEAWQGEDCLLYTSPSPRD